MRTTRVSGAKTCATRVRAALANAGLRTNLLTQPALQPQKPRGTVEPTHRHVRRPHPFT